MKRPTVKEVAWVLRECPVAMSVEIATLTEVPTREKFFAMLPDLDWEVKGGTQEEPRWAYEEHPWYAYLEITREDCDAFWDKRNAEVA